MIEAVTEIPFACPFCGAETTPTLACRSRHPDIMDVRSTCPGCHEQIHGAGIGAFQARADFEMKVAVRHGKAPEEFHIRPGLPPRRFGRR
jgi:hypothetical protein